MTFPIYISACPSLSLLLSFMALSFSLCLSLLLSVFFPLCVSLSAPWPLLTSICLSFFSVSCSPACCRLAGPALGRLSAGPLGSSPVLCRPALPLSWGGHQGHPTSSSSVCSSETEYNHLGSDSKPLPGGCLGPSLDHHPHPGFAPPPR